MSETPKPDLVITAVKGYRWENLRPFVISLLRSGFTGDKVILASDVDDFTTDCLETRDFIVQGFTSPSDNRFVDKHRFVPLLRFLARHKKEYRYVIWVDAGDQIFQSNPSDWLTQHAAPRTIIAARECWRIKDEQQFNDPWVKATTPDAYDWLREEEVLCGGTLAGDPETLFSIISQIYQIECDNPEAKDQAALNYVLRKPVNPRAHIPNMEDGWTATCSAFDTEGFHSIIGQPADKLLDTPPVFDKERGLVFTPDGCKPFVLVHQYNRDADWVNLIPTKYKWG